MPDSREARIQGTGGSGCSPNSSEEDCDDERRACHPGCSPSGIIIRNQQTPRALHDSSIAVSEANDLTCGRKDDRGAFSVYWAEKVERGFPSAFVTHAFKTPHDCWAKRSQNMSWHQRYARFQHGMTPRVSMIQ